MILNLRDNFSLIKLTGGPIYSCLNKNKVVKKKQKNNLNYINSSDCKELQSFGEACCPFDESFLNFLYLKHLFLSLK